MKFIEWFQRVALIWRRLRKRTLGKKRWSTIWTSKMVLVHPSPYMGVQAPFSTIRFGNVQQKGSTTELKKNLGRVDKARTRRTGDDGRDADKAFQFHTSLLKHPRQLRTYHIVRTPRVHHSKTRIQCCFWHAISIINFAVGSFEKRRALFHLSTRPTFSRISILALYK